jgi:hypothetical protein
MRPHITAVHFGPHSIRMKVDGHPTRASVHVNPRVPYVGHYSLTIPVIMVDRKITNPRERKSLEVHELHERFRRVHDHMQPTPAHRLSEREERHWAFHHGMTRHGWSRYSQNVEKVFRQNHRDGERRRR